MPRVFLSLLLAACASSQGSLTTRASRLEAEAADCESFSAFEARLSAERDALMSEGRGAELISVSRALSKARKACASGTIDRLLERRRRAGRGSVDAEVRALSRAYGGEATKAMLRARWGPDANELAAEALLGEYQPGPTPLAAPPTEPKVPASERPTLPDDSTFGEGAACLRRADLEAARCLAAWDRDRATRAEVDAALTQLVARLKRQLVAAEDDERARRYAQVLEVLALGEDRPPLAPLHAFLAFVADGTVQRATALLEAGAAEAAAVLVQPLLASGATRARAEAVARPAHEKHLELARRAAERPFAAQLHRLVAASFIGADEPAPHLEAGRWDEARWDCTLPKLKLPALPEGTLGRLVARCRALRKPAPEKTVDASMRTFELEAAMEKVRLDVDVSLTCAGQQTSRHFSVDELVMDSSVNDPEGPGAHRLEGPLSALLAEVATRCRSQVQAEASVDCQRLDRPALETEDAFTRHALRLGAWPKCFEVWFLSRYAVSPPSLK